MRNPNRTIIIPKGTLNSEDLNVVVVPPSLRNSNQPLIVKPTTTSNKLRAQSLPIWGDELDTSRPSVPPQRLLSNTIACGPGDEEEADMEFEGDDTDEFNPQFNSTKVCFTGPDAAGPQIVHVSSRTVNVTNDGPPECVEMTFDAPEGVAPNVFGNLLRQTASENVDESYGNFNPSFSSSFREPSPPFGASRNAPVGDVSQAWSAASYPFSMSDPSSAQSALYYQQAMAAAQAGGTFSRSNASTFASNPSCSYGVFDDLSSSVGYLRPGLPGQSPPPPVASPRRQQAPQQRSLPAQVQSQMCRGPCSSSFVQRTM